MPGTYTRKTLIFSLIFLAGLASSVRPVAAQTYISAEPIPSVEIVRATNLAKIENLAYPTRKLWGQLLLDDCHIVQHVMDVLSLNRTTTTVSLGDTRYHVAAGGFQGVTDPSYVYMYMIKDAGLLAANDTDIWVLDNALGYVLNQGGTAHFSIPYNQNNPFEFANDYAVVEFGGALTGDPAEQFFNYLGTIDVNLWTGTNAGFTQIHFGPFAVNNYMLDDSRLFLIGSVSTQEFEQGLYKAATTDPNMTYFPIGLAGKPTIPVASAALPGNDWTMSPRGQGYLTNVPNAAQQLLNELAALRQQHLEAVNNLLNAINNGDVGAYLNDQFRCPSLSNSIAD
jgi:hypothetical protein